MTRAPDERVRPGPATAQAEAAGTPKPMQEHEQDHRDRRAARRCRRYRRIRAAGERRSRAASGAGRGRAAARRSRMNGVDQSRICDVEPERFRSSPGKVSRNTSPSEKRLAHPVPSPEASGIEDDQRADDDDGADGGDDVRPPASSALVALAPGRSSRTCSGRERQSVTRRRSRAPPGSPASHSAWRASSSPLSDECGDRLVDAGW